jgi:hypothetical protein
MILAGLKAIWILHIQDQVYFGSCIANDSRLFWVLQKAGPKDS